MRKTTDMRLRLLRRVPWTREARLRRWIAWKNRWDCGGYLPPPRRPDDDTIPVLLSPGRSTTLRPGESHLEAMERLQDGNDL